MMYSAHFNAMGQAYVTITTDTAVHEVGPFGSIQLANQFGREYLMSDVSAS